MWGRMKGESIDEMSRVVVTELVDVKKTSKSLVEMFEIWRWELCPQRWEPQSIKSSENSVEW